MGDCPFCGGRVVTTSGVFGGVDELPGWRCIPCNVKMVVTNPSALPVDVWGKHPTCKRRAIAHEKIAHEKRVRSGSQTT